MFDSERLFNAQHLLLLRRCLLRVNDASDNFCENLLCRLDGKQLVIGDDDNA